MLACVLAHEVAYQLMYPGARAYRAAMTLMGHDGYWMGLVLAVVAASVALLVVAATQLGRLRREAAATPALAADEASGVAPYLRLVGPTWLRLAALAAAAYTAQENLEAMSAGLSFRGLDVILGHGLLPLLVILATTLLMALVVALVRWRRRVLLGRLAVTPVTWSRDAARRRAAGTRGPAPAGLPGRAWASRAPPRVASPSAL